MTGSAFQRKIDQGRESQAAAPPPPVRKPGCNDKSIRTPNTVVIKSRDPYGM